MFEEIKYQRLYRTIDLESLLDFLELKYEVLGDELRFNCVNIHHNDRHPSMSINFNPYSEKFGYFSCFGCNLSGSIPKLISIVKKCDREEAKEIALKFTTKIPVDEEVNYEKIILQKKKRVRRIKIKLPNEFMPIKLGMKNSYEKYILGRGVLPEDILKYGWGFCPKGLYQKRVVMPVYMKKELVFFYARHITNNDSIYKVKNPFDSTASKVIFPYDEIDFSLDYVYVVESVFNFFKLKRLGLKNIIVIFGNKIKEWKVKFFKQFKILNLIPDGDEGGEQMVKSFFTHLKNDCEIFSVKMIESEDVGSISLSQMKEVLKTSFKVTSSNLFSMKRYCSLDYSIKK